ncbi:MAG TPA: cation diffusion facilitator family transporter [Candidatus Omnitrophota bacterium]|nr:cation diffusion facilitator family transporter [Candidatus Omnitrophota bacterium]MDD5736787.1 cation diffusion facilitator family transporter [Candidatus Omnitrophota bacterium]HRZ66977.1 cation diffusion facilitator family transporter [Candidatus Omnitrophota bacterium]
MAGKKYPKRQEYVMRAALVSLWCNVVLFIFKGAAFFIVHSLAIATDFTITIVGLSVSIILFYSLKLAHRPADMMHNYGYGKIEHVCEAIEGIVLIGIALVMITQSAKSIVHPAHVNNPMLGLASSILSFTLNFGGSYYILKMGRKSGSPAVRAEGIHYMLEGFISFAIAGAFVLSMFLVSRGNDKVAIYIDPIVTMIVSVAIAVPSFGIARGAFSNLLDASIEEPGKMDVIVSLAQNAGLFCDFSDIRTRAAGHKKFINLKIILPAQLSFVEASKRAKKVEDDIISAVPESEAFVKIEACRRDCLVLKKGGECPYL